jgi:hypothetical protein
MLKVWASLYHVGGGPCIHIQVFLRKGLGAVSVDAFDLQTASGCNRTNGLWQGVLEGGARQGDLGKAGAGLIEVGKEFLVLVGGLLALSRRFIDLAQIKVRQGGEQWGAGAHGVEI